MNKKPLILSILFTILLSILFWYSLVFAEIEDLAIDEEKVIDTSIDLVYKTTDNIYLDSVNLNAIKLVFKSWQDLSSFKLYSKCNIYYNQSQKMWDFYTFNLKFFGDNCDSSRVELRKANNDKVYKFDLKMISKYDILSKMLDLNSTSLVRLKNVLDKKVLLYKKYSKYNHKIEKNYNSYLSKNRILKETLYNKKIIEEILEKRKDKYIVPVVGHKLPTRKDKLPNAWRPYRQNYTDWIHHSWDIDTKLGEKTVALDDAIVVRVVKDWKWQNFDKLKYWTLTESQKALNLDILRWNQVWLKTMKWEVVFYGHLDRIHENIRVWSIINKWDYIGTVWVSWVPDKKYTDYHLDFSIRENPYVIGKAGSYNLFDYMKWDWVFKWEDIQYILKNQHNVFES